MIPFDDVTPFMTVKGRKVLWPQGDVAFYMDHYKATRINAHGIMFVDTHWHMRNLTSLLWRATNCSATLQGLCAHSTGVILPITQVPKVYLNNSENLKCTQRLHERDVVNKVGYYDSSMCDIIDNGADWVVYDHQWFSRYSSIPLWEYVIITAFCIYIVRFFSHLTLKIAENAENVYQNIVYVVLSIVAMLALCIYNGDSTYITHEDLFVFAFNIFYVMYYLFILSIQLLYEDQNNIHVFNLTIGTLICVACRLYNTIQTPYTTFLLWALMTRTIHKTISSKTDTRREINVHVIFTYLTLIMDVFFISLLYTYAITWRHNYTIALSYVSYICNIFIYTYRVTGDKKGA